MNQPKLGFEPRQIQLALSSILPVRQIKDPHKTIRRYKAILNSIREVGLVEPLVVYPQKGAPKMYFLVDGHLRHAALRELGKTTADCIVAKDDECFTYNARINRLSPVQEHKMIMKAVKDGVRPERIATALNLPIHYVRASMNLLKGIDEKAADLIKDKQISPITIRLLKKVNALRQVEIVELMMSTNNFAAAYAEVLILGTPKHQLINPEQPKKKEGLSSEEIAQIEHEMEALQQDFKSVQANYNRDMMDMTVARGYIRKLLKNSKVIRFLSANYLAILSEFENIATTEVL